jgi:prophage DNA circulation protein
VTTSPTAGLLNVQGISNSTQGAVDVLARLESGSFWSQLRPASFGGIAFVVLAGSARFGRRQVVHEYPYRDTPWIEDMGRAVRRFSVSAFLVGDDVIARREKLISRVESKGAADLVHPTFGQLRVTLSDFTCTEKWDQGRYFELEMSFIEAGERRFPASTGSALSKVMASVQNAHAKSAAAFAQRALTALQTGATAANEAAKQANGWASVAISVSRDATSLINLAATLSGDFGRLVGQFNGLRSGQLLTPIFGRTADSLRGVAALARATIEGAAQRLSIAGAALTAGNAGAFGGPVQDLARTVREQAATPADALLMLAALAGVPSTSATAGAALVAQTQATRLTQRAAAAEMAAVAAQYQPASSDDAVSVRDLVVQVLDKQITMAGDEGDDDAFAALRTLRAAAVADINARGAALPELVVIESRSPIPSLVLAHRMYQDHTRATELVAQARPVHPAFMPLRFRGLSS